MTSIGTVYVSSTNPAGVYQLDGTTGLGPAILDSGDLGSPRGLAVDDSDNLDIADALDGDILRWPGSGVPASVAAAIGTPSQPHGLALVPPLFADGFESANVTGWSGSMP